MMMHALANFKFMKDRGLIFRLW